MKTVFPKKIIIKETKESGRGVFSSRLIKKGETIEISPLLIIPHFDYNALKTTIISFYWYSFDGRSCAIGLGSASLYNHSEKNNADFSINKKSKTIKIKATKDIKKGQEVLINYGYDVKKHNLSVFFSKKKKQ